MTLNSMFVLLAVIMVLILPSQRHQAMGFVSSYIQLSSRCGTPMAHLRTRLRFAAPGAAKRNKQRATGSNMRRKSAAGLWCIDDSEDKKSAEDSAKGSKGGSVDDDFSRRAFLATTLAPLASVSVTYLAAPILLSEETRKADWYQSNFATRMAGNCSCLCFTRVQVLGAHLNTKMLIRAQVYDTFLTAVVVRMGIRNGRL